MKNKLLSAGDLADVVPEVGQRRLARWLDDGLIVPVEGGDGRGDHRRFSIMQAIGLSVALAVKNSPRSCCNEYLGTVVASFGLLEPGELENLIERNGPYFLYTCAGSKPVLTCNYPSHPDAQAIHRDVTKRIEQTEKRVREKVARRVGNETKGRTRGLAAAD